MKPAAGTVGAESNPPAVPAGSAVNSALRMALLCESRIVIAEWTLSEHTLCFALGGAASSLP